MHTIRSPRALLLLVPLAAASLFFQACADSHASGLDEADPIEGAWESVVTVRDCASGTTLTTFRGAQVLHRGGTLSDTNSTPVTLRGPGSGLWARNDNGTYRVKFRFYRYNPDGTLAGSTVVISTRTLSADGNSASGDTRSELRDVAGNVLSTGCVSDAATRFN